MKSSCLTALFSLSLALSISAQAQDNIIEAPVPSNAETPSVIQSPAPANQTAEDTNSFDSILNRQLGEDDVVQPALTDQEQSDIENDLIDPDFLMDEGKQYNDYSRVKLRFLNKITAASETYTLDTNKTVAYGSLRLRPMACKKSPPIEQPESASFLQIWEKIPDEDDKWIFSGWMFSSSPSLSAMEHPIYDVWVVDCLDSGQGGNDDNAETDVTETNEGDPSDEADMQP